MNLSPTTVTSQGHSSTANSGNATASTVGASTNGNWARCKVKYDHNTPNWWKRISEDTEYRPQEQDGISKRRQEYRLAIEENTLLREKLRFQNAESLETAIDFLWTCNFGGESPPDDSILQTIHNEIPNDPGYNIATLTRRIYREALARTSYSDKYKRKILDNHLIWLLCQTLKPDLPPHLPNMAGPERQWDDLWDIIPFANHVGRWKPMISHYSTTPMAQWIMACERCIFADRASTSAENTTIRRRGRAVAVIEILINLYHCVIFPRFPRQRPENWDLRESLKLFLKNIPSDLWENAFPGCARDKSSIQSTLAKNLDLMLAALGFLGDKTFEEAFKKWWYLTDIKSQPSASRFVPPELVLPDATVLGMFPEGPCKKSHDFIPSALDAWFISSGRFKLKGTEDLKQHLRLDHSIRTVYVYIGANTFENGRLAFLHDTVIGRMFSLDLLWDELQMTYSLLFGQTALGKKIGSEMIASTNPENQRIPPMPEAIRERKVRGRHGYLVYKETPDSEFTFEDWGTEKQMPRASSRPPIPSDFQYFGPRLELLYKHMLADQPRTYLDVFRPGYTDRFTWYTQMFAMFIAFLGVLNVILSLVQTVYTGVAYRDAKSLAVQANDLAMQQLNASIAALNVSLQQLLLQKVQMNITTL